MIFFNPPTPHPRFGEIIYFDTNDGWKEGKIYWIYGPDKFYLIGFNNSEYIEGIKFQIIPSDRVKLG
jgi:hypothetical protein